MNYQAKIYFPNVFRRAGYEPRATTKGGTPCKNTCGLPKESSCCTPGQNPEVLHSINADGGVFVDFGGEVGFGFFEAAQGVDQFGVQGVLGDHAGTISQFFDGIDV